MEADSRIQQAAAEMRRFYTDTVVDHVLSPRNFGPLADADGFAGVTTGGGDTMKMWLRVKDNRVTDAGFWTDACAATVASLSIVTGMVAGRTVAGALRIDRQEVLDALGGLPEGNIHCAGQAVDILREAIRDYLDVKRQPWKKQYRHQ